MKILIMFILSFNCFAGHFLPKSKIGKTTEGITLYRTALECKATYKEKCISIRKTGNMAYHKIKKAKYLKEQSQICLGVSDCLEKFNKLFCRSNGFYKIRTIENNEVYCTKFEKAHVVEDLALKTSYMTNETKTKKDKEKKKKKKKDLSDKLKTKDLSLKELNSLIREML